MYTVFQKMSQVPHAVTFTYANRFSAEINDKVRNQKVPNFPMSTTN